ncbi:DUF2076 domain-containing protein [Roseococcus microcysteis]|uniref:DUF2076 domain-containing protein n=1 Tax=Roseococcus microcysteis TaxID=2771361 RepID=UPI00168AC9EF|nr:DUF2076 family protein [Roseococcus microcysteis]
MTDEERRIITDYVLRVAGAQPASPAQAAPGRMPNTGAAAAQPLPPVEPQADALIAELFAKHPEARFRITQTAFVQEHALVAAQNRIKELEWELEKAQREGQAAQNRGFFGFGGQKPVAMPPRPEPQFPPGHNPQALQGRQGPGFLGTAMMTAAGVAGGMVLGNMLMGMMGGGGAQAAGASGGDFAQEAVPASSPWTDPGAAAEQQGWGTPQQDAGGGYDDAGGQDAYGAYDDAGYDDGGGFDDDL